MPLPAYLQVTNRMTESRLGTSAEDCGGLAEMPCWERETRRGRGSPAGARGRYLSAPGERDQGAIAGVREGCFMFGGPKGPSLRDDRRHASRRRAPLPGDWSAQQ